MIVQDNFKYPIKGMKEVKRPQTTFLDINPAYMEQARNMVRDECGVLDHYPMHDFLEA